MAVPIIKETKDPVFCAIPNNFILTYLLRGLNKVSLRTNTHSSAVNQSSSCHPYKGWGDSILVLVQKMKRKYSSFNSSFTEDTQGGKIGGKEEKDEHINLC